MQQALDPAYLLDQYGTTAKLNIRIEAHERYSERKDDFPEWVLEHVDAKPGDLVLDIGCGPGAYHAKLVKRGARAVVGIDTSPGMVAATQQQANASGLPVVAVEASADKLPLPDASYDVAMANHVLFLVDDVPTALREIRRVLKPTGHAALTTNARDHCPRLHELHRAAAEQLGYRPVDRVIARFNLDHLSLVQQVFSHVERFVRDDAFVFPSTESALRYYASGMIDAIDNPPADGSHRVQLLRIVGEGVQAIVDREGVFRDPKNSGCFVARP